MRFKVFIIGIFIFLIGVIQSTILNYFEVYNVKPNLLVVFIILSALLRGNTEGAVIGFFAGLSQDIIAGKVVGFYALLGLYLGLVVGSLNKRLYRENFLVAIFFTFFSTIAYELAVYLMYKGGEYIVAPTAGIQFNVLFVLKHIVLPEAVYNSGISVFMYMLVMKLFQKLEYLDKAARKY
ncbi:MAG: rod shape-determining protein MreD [Clostridiales bacterium]|jgi:rod shape-determining protein MreD|nr:rod shape-determining protein MreD [Eubacteriales bacterium]MDH7566401.1 rod shape-determining protein MreD [Clostridiales bacterium]